MISDKDNQQAHKSLNTTQTRQQETTTRQQQHPPKIVSQHSSITMAELNYPNLCGCKVQLTSSTAGSRPPVKLPRESMEVLSSISIPPPYDFALGKLFL